MITLESVAVSGVSLAGKFRGELRFSNGLQVVSADNAFGKSLSVTTIAWCMGAEAVFGLPDNDPSCFPLAVRDEINLEELLSSPVLSSQCTILLVKDSHERLMLTRAIKGDCSRISCEEISASGSVRHSTFSARYRSMSDATEGFQHFFFKWLG